MSTNFGPLVGLKMNGGGFVRGYADGGGKVDLARRGILGLSKLFAPKVSENLPAVIPTSPLANLQKEVAATPPASPLAALVEKTIETPMTRRDILRQGSARAIGNVLPEIPLVQAAKSVVKKVAEPVDPISVIKNLPSLTEKDIARILERAKNPKYDIYKPNDIHEFMEYFGGNEYIDKQLMRKINKKNNGLTRKQFSEMLEEDEDLEEAFLDRSANEYQNVFDLIEKHLFSDPEP